jgi:RND family efflux transporter MFP subunit
MMGKNSDKQNKEGQGPAAPKPIVRIVLSIILIAAGIAGARYLIHTKPKVNRRPPVRMAPLVKTIPLELGTYMINIPAMGLVVPAQEVNLKVPVGGEIIELSPEFTPGGKLQGNTLMLQIDPKDYELTLQQKQSSLSDAEYAYKLELGRQDVAKREWNLLYGDQKTDQVESDLALRKPHLEKAEADIEAAKAELELARINLARTKVTAPFNALVLNKYVDLGSEVSPQDKLADLVGTDAYWVQVSVPVEHLKWLKIPRDKGEAGASATIFYREGSTRQGKVIRLLPDLSKEGRMARLLIEVKDPLDLVTAKSRRPPLLIGEYVRVLIDGAPLKDVYRIPRFALRDDEQIWLADKESKLAIRPVKTLWREEEYVYVKDGLHPDDLLIVSALATPVDGMELRLEQAEGEIAGDIEKKQESSEPTKQ